MAFIGAIKVKVGVKTSSPLLTPANLRLIWIALVALIKAIACFEPTYLQIFFSNLFTNFPEVTHPVEIHSFKYFFSLPWKIGSI